MGKRPAPQAPDTSTSKTDHASEYFNTITDCSIEELESKFGELKITTADQFLSELSTHDEFPEDIHPEDIHIQPKKATYKLVVNRECKRNHKQRTDQSILDETVRGQLSESDLDAETPPDFDDFGVEFKSTEKQYYSNKEVRECKTCRGSLTHSCDECSGKGTRNCRECRSDGEISCKSCYGDGTEDCSFCNGTTKKGCTNCSGGTYSCSNCDGKGIYDCEECGGKSEIDCSECNGKGNKVCENCSGDKVVTCDNCNGDGEIDTDSGTSSCPNCNGSGEMRCPKCQGSGSKGCSNCNGAGSFDCGECDDHGKIKCYNCDQTGELHCDRCDGTGSRECTHCDPSGEVECSNCNGEGYFPCSNCDGEGDVPCTNCDGEGDVTCTTCNGEGELIDYTAINVIWLEKRNSEPPKATQLDGWKLSQSEIVSENPIPQSDENVTCLQREFIYELQVILFEYEYDYESYQAYAVGPDSNLLYEELPGGGFNHEYDDHDEYGNSSKSQNHTFSSPIELSWLIVTLGLILILAILFITGVI